MPRRVPEGRIDELVRVAAETFIAQGYRRTQMDDIARALGVAKGTLYGYVTSKRALFELVLRSYPNDDRPGPIPVPARLPIPEPPAGATERLLEEVLAAATQPSLAQALATAAPEDPRAELEAIVRELYATMRSERIGIKLIERCKRDFPELEAIWEKAGRGAVRAGLEAWLASRVASGIMKAPPDVEVAARFINECIATWAVHIHWDQNPARYDEAVTEDTVVYFVSAGLFADDAPV